MDDVRVPARPHKLSLRIAVVAFAATLGLALTTGTAAAAPKMTVLGAAAPATPACPNGCQAVGKMTGYQTRIGKDKNPFVVPYPGKVVAWSIKLGAPNQTQLDFFKNFYGGDPEARISVLKPIAKQIKAGRQMYKLKSQSPVEQLLPYLGTTTTFTLQAPLKVNTGQVVALTSETWIPAFSINLPEDSIWRASRKKGKCTKADDIKAGSAHTKLGQDRNYACQYKTARLLYSATVVRNPNAPEPPDKKKQ
ncbi:MAG: hypothetical protein ACRDL6_02525 [Solirubrobacterales bacterium]